MGTNLNKFNRKIDPEKITLFKNMQQLTKNLIIIPISIQKPTKYRNAFCVTVDCIGTKASLKARKRKVEFCGIGIDRSIAVDTIHSQSHASQERTESRSSNSSM